MTSRLDAIRRNIEAQGFCGLDDETCARLNNPLRLSPAICMTWAAIGTAWSFQAGLPVAGRVLGWSLVAAAFVNVSLGFCIPSFLVRVLFGKVVCEPPGQAAPTR
mgnify:CR=1 FL=1